MATGRLTSKYVALIPIELFGKPYEAVIDTGFEGSLQLPNSLFQLVNPVHYRFLTYEYGAGQTGTMPSYWVKLTIDGIEYQAETIFADTDQLLIGVEMLTGFRLEIHFVTGLVLLERMPTP